MDQPFWCSPEMSIMSTLSTAGGSELEIPGAVRNVRTVAWNTGEGDVEVHYQLLPSRFIDDDGWFLCGGNISSRPNPA